jgi:hypothetical protein
MPCERPMLASRGGPVKGLLRFASTDADPHIVCSGMQIRMVRGIQVGMAMSRA